MSDLKKQPLETHPKWNDWRWQLDQSSECAAPFFKGNLFKAAITPYYLSLFDPLDESDPLRRMAVPDPEEGVPPRTTSHDPICEEDHAIFPGLMRRYPDRVLILATGECPVYCRHCTRRIMGKGSIVPVSPEGFERCLSYLREHPKVRDVIISGGDPLVMGDEELIAMAAKVRAVPSVEIIRVATRAPVTLPMRITRNLAIGLSRLGPLYVNTQFNHPKELTPQAHTAVSTLVDAGIPVNNQSVLLSGVNDDPKTLEDLCRGLLKMRVKPYYLFMCDLVEGTEHFRVDLRRAVEIVSALRGKISGMGIPQLVVDLPGGVGKVPVGADYIVEHLEDHSVIRSPDGALIKYPSIR